MSNPNNSSGSGVTADGKYAFTYDIAPVSSQLIRDNNFANCQPIRVDNYKAFITLTPNSPQAITSSRVVLANPSYSYHTVPQAQTLRTVTLRQAQPADQITWTVTNDTPSIQPATASTSQGAAQTIVYSSAGSSAQNAPSPTYIQLAPY